MSTTGGRRLLRSLFPRAWIAQHKKILRKILLITLSMLVVLPAVLILLEVMHGLSVYRQLQGQMQDGVTHLEAAAHAFPSHSGAGIAPYFDTGNLQQAQKEIDLAHDDFTTLNATLAHDSTISLAAPFWSKQINTARALGHIAADGTAVAQRLLKTLRTIAPSVALALQQNASSTAPDSPTPYLTPASYQEIYTALDAVAPLIQRMTIDAQGVSLNDLPFSAKQQQMIASMLALLPSLDAILKQRGELGNPLAWALGIDGQRTFLIEPMDTAELRATGGFTGQFGDLVLNGAHPGPLKLTNLGVYEEDHAYEGSPPDWAIFRKVVGQSAPKPYLDWWPIVNFGVRDANLSADFPTSARIVINRYRYEFGSQVDGVIMFTPALIEDVLRVTGPLAIPAYHQIVTPQNLEDLLHYYQLSGAGLYQEETVEHISDREIARKLFTQRVTTALIDAVTHLPLDKMLSLGSEMLQAMKSKDLQVYVTNTQVEALIGKYGSTASLDRSSAHDGLFIVQSNLSANKSSQYVTTSIQDTIQLDTQGGATHQLQLSLAYQQQGEIYSLFPTYRDYVRIYVPENSQLLSGDGFDQSGRPYCGDAQSGYRLCKPDVYGDGSLVCTSPIQVGDAPDLIDDPYAHSDHPLDVIGPPENQHSDEAGRAMFAGWVVIPRGCTMKVTLSWYVPPMSQQPYSLLFQAQAGVSSPLDLTIQLPAGTCVPHYGSALHFSQIIAGEDSWFGLQQQWSDCS